MAAQDLFQELHSALQDFKKFLDDHTGDIKPAVPLLNQLTGNRITDLLTKLVDLMNQIKAKVDSIDISTIPGLAQVTAFSQGITSLLTTAKNLLPDEASNIDTVLSATSVLSGLSSVTTDIKKEIDDAIDAIVGHLNELKAAG